MISPQTEATRWIQRYTKGVCVLRYKAFDDNCASKTSSSLGQKSTCYALLSMKILSDLFQSDYFWNPEALITDLNWFYLPHSPFCIDINLNCKFEYRLVSKVGDIMYNTGWSVLCCRPCMFENIWGQIKQHRRIKNKVTSFKSIKYCTKKSIFSLRKTSYSKSCAKYATFDIEPTGINRLKPDKHQIPVTGRN